MSANVTIQTMVDEDDNRMRISFHSGEPVSSADMSDTYAGLFGFIRLLQSCVLESAARRAIADVQSAIDEENVGDEWELIADEHTVKFIMKHLLEDSDDSYYVQALESLIVEGCAYAPVSISCCDGGFILDSAVSDVQDMAAWLERYEWKTEDDLWPWYESQCETEARGKRLARRIDSLYCRTVYAEAHEE